MTSDSEHVVGRLNDQYESLTLHLLRLKHQLEVAEAVAQGLNSLVAEVWQLGLLPRTVFLGAVIETRCYSVEPGGHSSGEVVQAALLIPGGFGVALWDTEDFDDLSAQPSTLEAAAFGHHVPFEDCELALRAKLEPHIEPLVDQLVRALK